MKNIPRTIKGVFLPGTAHFLIKPARAAFHERQADALFAVFSTGDIVPPVKGKH